VHTPLQVSCFLTTFPKQSEVFLQREILFLHQCLHELKLISIHRGESEFQGIPVERFNKWRLLTLIYWLPYWMILRPRPFFRTLADLFRNPCPSFLNFQETLLGLGFALCESRRLAGTHPAHWNHAAWATMPATAALAMRRFTGRAFSMEAHAYDIFTGSGDWLIRRKIDECSFIRTSSMAARRRLMVLGAPEGKIHCIRRGLDTLPPPQARQPGISAPFHLISVGRLVPKKGFFWLLDLLVEMRNREIAYTVDIVGDGPLRTDLQKRVKTLNLEEFIRFPGFLKPMELQEYYQCADALLFTGTIAPDGNRDGLPNVIPEAMAAGTLVLTTDVGATKEAVHHGKTGFILPRESKRDWIDQLIRLSRNPEECERIRRNARTWVSENFLVDKNLSRMIQCFQECAQR